jgi:tetrahydromethanopterin S-methyltransferase subunit G
LEQAARDLEDVRHRLAEVEERQDFAERMIAQRADPARPGLPGPER